jgi:hypothetical protein
VRSFETIVTRLREAGHTSGTIFLATDNATIAAQAVKASIDGFTVVALGEDRTKVEKSHARGDRRREGDEMLHLQLLDLALRPLHTTPVSNATPTHNTAAHRRAPPESSCARQLTSLRRVRGAALRVQSRRLT